MNRHNRRKFLFGLSFFGLAVLSANAQTLFSGAPISQFNSGKSQIQSNFVAAGRTGDWPFLNLMKTADLYWTLADNSGCPSPETLDANGYPTSVSHGGVYTVITIPDQATRPGRYAVTWNSAGGTTTVIAGNIPVSNPTGSKSTSSATGRYEFLPGSSGATAPQIGIATAGVSNLKFFHVDDEALLNQGKIFGQKFLQIMRQANCGVVRFLNWQQGNASNVTTWATHKSADYIWWAGDEWRPSLIATPSGSPMTNSGNDYAITFGSGAPTDKQTFHAIFNAAITLVQAAVTYTAGAPGTVNATAHPFANGDPVGISSSSSEPTLIFRGVNYYVVNAAANTFQLALSPGGTAVAIGTGGAGTQTVTRNATLNLNSTGAVTLKSANGETLSSSGSLPQLGNWVTMVYDADINSYLIYTNISASVGLVNCVPPEVLFQLANELGSHPYFVSPKMALDPMTDWHTGLATYCKTNAPPWMIPRYETLNETWNSGGSGVARYAWIKSFLHWAIQFNTVNWVGKVGSTMGQALSDVYGSAINKTKWCAIAGVQTSGFTSTGSANANDPIMTSAQYVAQAAPAQSGYVKEPASNWLTHACAANYFVPGIYGTGTETTLAAAWAGGDLTALSTYVDNCNAASATPFNLAQLRIYWGFLFTWTQKFTNRDGVKIGMTAYEGGYSPDTNDGSSTQIRNFRQASAMIADVGVCINGGTLVDGTMPAGSYNDFVAAGGEFPSCFQLSGAGNTDIWGVLNPNIYLSPQPAQFLAIVSFNH